MPNLEVMGRLANALSKFSEALFKGDDSLQDDIQSFMTQDLQDTLKELQAEGQKAYNEGDFHGYLRANVKLLETLMPDLEQTVGWERISSQWPTDARNNAMINAIKFYGGTELARLAQYSFKPPTTPPNNNGGNGVRPTGPSPTPGFGGGKGGFGPIRG